MTEPVGCQRLSVLGSTGSIGRSTLEVVRHHPDRLAVQALAAYGSDLDLLVEQVREFRPTLLAIFDAGAAQEIAGRIAPEVEVVSGDEGLHAAAVHPRVEKVVAAMVGAAGLRPVYAALEAGKDVALANKESLVVAGALLTELAERTRARILPIDSEHAALHQALRCGGRGEVRRLVLTASGGPFLDTDPAAWGSIRPADAIQHPNWEMGAKISVDSATLMNKGLELIEAHHLFGLPGECLDVVIHPQSVVHSMVEFHDGSWIAQLGANDMVLPIQYALAHPERWENSFPTLEPRELGRLEFREVPSELSVAVDLARAALEAGGSCPAVLNAANEEAVGAFLDRRIRFAEILEVVSGVLEGHGGEPLADLEGALSWDRWARERAAAEIRDRQA